MVLRFCQKCKTLLSPRKRDGKIFLECKDCGFSKEVKKRDLVSKNKIHAPEKRGKGFVKDEDIFATYEHECKKCGYNKAQVLDVGIFYSDEDNLILLKCGKCGHSERVGRKVG